MSFTQEELSLVVKALSEHKTQQAAADSLNLNRRAFQRRLYEANKSEPTFEEQVLLDSADSHGFPADDTSMYWVKTEKGSFCVKRDSAMSYSDIRDELIEDMKRHAPIYKKISHDPGEHLLVMSLFDVHFGKLSAVEETGCKYDLNVAQNRVADGVAALLSKARVHGVSKIIMVLGNDHLHVDNPKRTTTSGTSQDTDGQWFEAFQTAKSSYISAIEVLAAVADVHLIHVPSNHDFMSGYMLTDSICSHFANHPSVHVEASSVSIAHRKYIQFGDNLLGFSHGDGAKEKDLPNLMQLESRKEWGETKFAYWYLGHYHHKQKRSYGSGMAQIEKDYIGVTVLQAGNGENITNSVFTEIIRSPSAPDSWHHRNGYVNGAAVECFLHHPDKGQVARFTEFF